jgi:hypothetical protein
MAASKATARSKKNKSRPPKLNARGSAVSEAARENAGAYIDAQHQKSS